MKEVSITRYLICMLLVCTPCLRYYTKLYYTYVDADMVQQTVYSAEEGQAESGETYKHTVLYCILYCAIAYYICIHLTSLNRILSILCIYSSNGCITFYVFSQLYNIYIYIYIYLPTHVSI